MRVECPAELHLIGSIRAGKLSDLSVTGARFQTGEPPQAGLSGMLKWQTHEAFCKVVWSVGELCGLAFDRPLKRALIDRTLEHEARTAPVAAVGNIPLGQKRSRPGATSA